MTDRNPVRPAPAADRPWSELSDRERCAVLDWVVDTCLLFGAQRTTAYAVASEFARGLDPEPQPRRVLAPILPKEWRALARRGKP